MNGGSHNLGIRIEDSCSLDTFIVSDASVYIDNIPVTNGILDITPPSLTIPTYAMRVIKNFRVVLNPSNLKIAPANGASYSPLPDGNYNIKYSVAPNQDVFCRFYYFRNLTQVFKWRDMICDLYGNKCNLSSKDFYDLRRDMLFIKQHIDATKFMAEDKLDVFKANEMYSEGEDLLTKFGEKLTCLIK